jgi:Holliday junction DNA helicase RuvB
MSFLDSLYEATGINCAMELFKEDKKEETIIESSEEKIAKEEVYIPKEIKPVKFIYRPQNLSEYIGQENAKKQVNLTLKKIRTLKPVHIVISGHKGAGKSTLAHIIGKELQAKIVWYIGGSFTKYSLLDFLDKNQKDINNLYVLFVDEGHNLLKALGEYMYPILEDFILPEENNPPLKPFIFITATTEKNTLIKKFSPLVDRCGCDIVLEPYKPDDIMSIIKQANDKLYQKNIEEECYDLIAHNCRYTPRIALAMLDDLIVSEDIGIVLSARRIVKNSLTDIDLKILSHLIEVGKPVGEQALAVISNQGVEDFRLLYEPFLIQEGYLTRTARGRIGTEKAKQLLKEAS